MRSSLCARFLILPLSALLLGPGGCASSASDEQSHAAPAAESAQRQLFLQLQQLQDEVANLRGIEEEQQNQIQTLRKENLERYEELDRRLSGGAGQDSSAGAGAAATAGGSQQAADPQKEKLYYDAAFDFLRQKDYDKANRAFRAFIARFPQSVYAGNAQYWLGEVSLAQGDLNGAKDAFSKVQQNYPQHSKVPDALYKLADVERRLGNGDKADSLLQQVVSNYPNSSAAQLAKGERGRMN